MIGALVTIVASLALTHPSPFLARPGLVKLADGPILVAAADPPQGTRHTTRTVRAATVGNAARPKTATLTHRDLLYGVTAVAAVAVAYPFDERVQRQWSGQGGRTADDLASVGRRFGGPTPIIALGVAGLGALAFHDRDRAASIARVSVGLLSANAASYGLKFVAGRYRPRESPGDNGRFKPFSGHESLPSGHATTAFALASGLSTEVGGGWVPWVAYPLATLTAWSRVHDDQHWLSDVVAGAFIGHWIGRKVVQLQRDRAGLGPGGHANNLDVTMPESQMLALRWTF